MAEEMNTRARRERESAETAQAELDRMRAQANPDLLPRRGDPTALIPPMRPEPAKPVSLPGSLAPGGVESFVGPTAKSTSGPPLPAGQPEGPPLPAGQSEGQILPTGQPPAGGGNGFDVQKVAEGNLPLDDGKEIDVDKDIEEIEGGGFSFKKLLSKVLTKGNIAKGLAVAAPTAIGAALGGKEGAAAGFRFGAEALAGYETERQRRVTEAEELAIKQRKNLIEEAKTRATIQSTAVGHAQRGDTQAGLLSLEPLGNLYGDLSVKEREEIIKEINNNIINISTVATANIAIGGISTSLKALIDKPITSTPDQFEELHTQLENYKLRDGTDSDDFSFNDAQRAQVEALITKVAHAKTGDINEESNRKLTMYMGLIKEVTTTPELFGLRSSIRSEGLSTQLTGPDMALVIATIDARAESVRLAEEVTRADLKHRRSLTTINDQNMLASLVYAGDYIGAMKYADTMGIETSISELYAKDNHNIRIEVTKAILDYELRLITDTQQLLDVGTNIPALRTQLFDFKKDDKGKRVIVGLNQKFKEALQAMRDLAVNGHQRVAARALYNTRSLEKLNKLATIAFNEAFAQETKKRPDLQGTDIEDEGFVKLLKAAVLDDVAAAMISEQMTDLTKTFYIESLLDHANITYNLNIDIKKTLEDLMPKPPPKETRQEDAETQGFQPLLKRWSPGLFASLDRSARKDLLPEAFEGGFYGPGGTPPGGTPLKTPSSQGDPANDPFAEFDDIFKDLTLTGPTPIPTVGDTTGSTSGPPQPAPSGLPDLVGGP